jgi:hypothetical protein
MAAMANGMPFASATITQCAGCQLTDVPHGGIEGGEDADLCERQTRAGKKRRRFSIFALVLGLEFRCVMCASRDECSLVSRTNKTESTRPISVASPRCCGPARSTFMITVVDQHKP